ncbi:MAG: 6-phosphofructokinase [Sandaracinaceae bacterium]|nr:6-phosphofructokinase [Sandaracinaceae bacterium]
MSKDVRSSAGIRRVGIVFAGGPAPGANAVISAAAGSFLDEGCEVVGFFHGYSNLQEYDRTTRPLKEDEDYRLLTDDDVWGIRNTRGVLVGTARAHPGRGIHSLADLASEAKTVRLRAVYQALVDLEIDALISIGGDGTLMTANFLYEYQKRLAPNARRVRIVHVPKTIDNDYRGIDFTFGFFTAIDVLAKEVLNLRADALATSSYFIIETMGRNAGWLAYGVAVAGEADLVIAAEDIDDALSVFEDAVDEDGRVERVRRLNVDVLVERILDLITRREADHRKHYGTVILAEGLAKMLPADIVSSAQNGRIDFPHLVAERVASRYAEKTGESKKITGVKLGYEARSAAPHAFDVLLASQLGVGAFRALVERGLDGHMVSVSGQLELSSVPFADLVDAETMMTKPRMLSTGSDFHRLARFLETRTDRLWRVGRRREQR